VVRVGADGIFRRVKVRIWRSGSFSRLSRVAPSGQGLWLYLLTCPESCSIPGVILAGRAQLAEALDWSLRDFDRCYSEIADEGMSVADWNARLVWLARGPYENPPNSVNVVKAWAPVFRTLPDCKLKARIYRDLRNFTKAYGDAFAYAFTDAFGDAIPKGIRTSMRHQGVGSRDEGSREEGRDVVERGQRTTTTQPELPPDDDPPTPPLGHRFTPPTADDLRAHIAEKHYTFTPEAFLAYYTANGWKVGRNAMKDWRAACVTWQGREQPRPAMTPKPPTLCRDCRQPMTKPETMEGTTCRACREDHGV